MFAMTTPRSLLRIFSYSLVCLALVSFGVVRKANAATPTPTPTPIPEIHPTWGAIQTNTPVVTTFTPAPTADKSGCADGVTSAEGLDPGWVAFCSLCVGSTATPVATVPGFVIGTVPPIGTAVTSTALPTIPPMYVPGSLPSTATPYPTTVPGTWSIEYDFSTGAHGWIVPPGYPGSFSSGGFNVTGFASGPGRFLQAFIDYTFDSVYITQVDVYYTNASTTDNDNIAEPNLPKIQISWGGSSPGGHEYHVDGTDGVIGHSPNSYVTELLVRTYVGYRSDSTYPTGTMKVHKIVVSGTGDVIGGATPTPRPTVTPVSGFYDCSVPLTYDTSTPVASVEFDNTDLGENCYTIIPEINITATDPDITYPGLQLCIQWHAVPTVGILGVEFQIDLLLIIPAAFLVRRMLVM